MDTDKIYAENLAAEYAPKDDSKVMALKRLDRRAKLPANVLGYTLGIVSALVAGLGMSLSMGVLGVSGIHMVLGVILGVVGFAGCGLNYLLYRRMLAKGRSKYAYEITELAHQIAQE